MSEMNPNTMEYYYASFNQLLKKLSIDLDDENTVGRIFIAPENSKGVKGYTKQEIAGGTHSLDMDSEGAEFTGKDRAQIIMDHLNKGDHIYVYEPGAAHPRRLTIGNEGPVVSNEIRSPKNVPEPKVKEPKKPGMFASFLNKITFGYAYKNTFATYNTNLKAYETEQKEIAAAQEVFDKESAIHKDAVQKLKGVSYLRNLKAERAYAREKFGEKDNEMTVDELSGKQAEQSNKTRVSTQTITKSMQMEGPDC